jgi:membrane protein implicated in regulation of membrane protease activity
MSESTIWWLIAGFFISLELVSRSYYLLTLAGGAVAAAILASIGASQPTQMLAAALVGGGTLLLWHRKPLRRATIDTLGYNTTGLGDLDVGVQVIVSRWQPDGTAHVLYRGAEWLARHHGPHTPRTGEHRILAIEPTCLVLEPV